MMPANDDFCDHSKGATTFHLFSMTDAARKQLKPLLGTTVSVKAVGAVLFRARLDMGDVAEPGEAPRASIYN